VIRSYSTPRTPYVRLIEAAILDQEQEQDLQEYKSGLNACHLQRELTAAIARLQRYSKVTSSREATKAA